MYDDIRDTKIRSQSLRRTLLPPSFERSSEKLLMGSATEIDHFIAMPSPCSTPTPYYRNNRMASPVTCQVSLQKTDLILSGDLYYN